MMGIKQFILLAFLGFYGNCFGQVKVAIIQYAVQQPDSVGIDDDRFESFVREAASNGAQLIVGPETSFYRYAPRMQNNVSILDLANEYDSLIKRYSDLAKSIGIDLVIGLREPSGDSVKPVYNTCLYFGKSGKILGKHRKMTPSSAEIGFTKSGDLKKGDGKPFHTSFGLVGMLICKDMDNSLGCQNCPDWDVQLAKNKLDLFIGVSGDPSRGWVKIVRGCKLARCYGIGSNLAQSPGAKRTGGGSGFVNPDGKVISEAGLGEKIIYQILPLKINKVF